MESAQAQDTSRVAELEAQRAAGEELRAQVCLCVLHLYLRRPRGRS